MFGVVEEMRTWECYNCIYLDKSRKQTGKNGTGCFRYGCNARLTDSYICGYMGKDNELKTMGCSNSNILHFGTEFTVGIYQILYLGSYNGKRILYNLNTKKHKFVDNEWLKKQKGKIRIITEYGKDKMCLDLRKDIIGNEKRRKQKL